MHIVSDQSQCLAFFKMSGLATGFLLFLPCKIPTFSSFLHLRCTGKEMTAQAMSNSPSHFNINMA